MPRFRASDWEQIKVDWNKENLMGTKEISWNLMRTKGF
jgi:hypothetical protein